MGKPSAPPPPDYSALSTASVDVANISAQTSKDSLDWAKEQYGKSSAQQQKMYDDFLTYQKGQDTINNASVKKAQEQGDKTIGQSQQVLDDSLARAKVNDLNAQQDRSWYITKYRPLEEKAITDADSYASPERTNLEVGKAKAGVAQSFDAQRAGALKNLEGFGINPSSTRYAALDIGLRASKAAAMAAAGSNASQMVEDKGRGLRAEAINVGRGYPGQVAQSYNTASAAGSLASQAGASNAGVANAAAQTGFGGSAAGGNLYGVGTGIYNAGTNAAATYGNMMGSAPQWAGIALNGYNTAGGLTNMGYQNSLDGYKATQASSSGIGALAGLAGGMAKNFGLAEGGVIPTEASPSAGAIPDDVQARVQPGEFVVPRDVLQWKGEEFFQKTIEQARKSKPQAPAQAQVKPALSGPATYASPGAAQGALAGV